MKTKHTKGEWTIVYPYGEEAYPGIDAIGKHGEGSFSVIILGTKDELCGIQGQTSEERKANAQLIASAPDLLRACTDILRNFELNRDLNGYNITKQEIDAAIGILTRVVKKATE